MLICRRSRSGSSAETVVSAIANVLSVTIAQLVELLDDSAVDDDS
jgi:hypothetical protein